MKCFVPYGTDIDMYRDAAYFGGIPSTRFISDWCNRTRKSSPRWSDAMEYEVIMNAYPFDDGIYESVSPQPGGEGVPCFTAIAQFFILRGHGAFEAYRARKETTYLHVVDSDYYPWPCHQAKDKNLKFLDRYLKGVEVHLEKVGIQMRPGNSQWRWREESDWPVPGTTYMKWHLRRNGRLLLDSEQSDTERFPYSTKVLSNAKAGISFTSAPLEQDLKFAGHFSASLNTSSSVEEADVMGLRYGQLMKRTKLWHMVCIPVRNPLRRMCYVQVIGRWMQKSPYQNALGILTNHKTNSCWKNGEVVQLLIEVLPAAAMVHRGWNLRLDIMPTEDQPEILGYKPLEMRVFYEEETEKATNTIHTGPGLETSFRVHWYRGGPLTVTSCSHWGVS